MPPEEREAVLRLALPAADLVTAPGVDDVVLSRHAVQRYRERVENVPRRLAVRRVRRLLATAQWRSRPRAWTNVLLHDDVIYGYSPLRPDVCLLVRDGVLVTVLSRKFLDQGLPQHRTSRCG